MRRAVPLAGCLGLLALFGLRADYFARQNAQTFDEGAHLVAGVSYWRTGDFRLNPEHPPLLKLLWALPVAVRSDVPFEPDPDAWEQRDHWRLADEFLYAGPVDHLELLLAARRVNIGLGVLIVGLIAWWAFRVWGPGAAVLACALAAFDPNLAAFAALLSMDLGLALFALAASYCLWEYAGSGSAGWFYAGGGALGLALASKFPAVLTVSGLGAGAIGYALAGGRFGVPGHDAGGNRKERVRGVFAAFVRLGLVAAGVVAVTYGVIHLLDWAAGLKHQMSRRAHGDPHFFLDGEISSVGWYGYFPTVLAVKTPPATLLLAGCSLLFWTGGKRFTARDLAFLLAPAAVYFLAMVGTRINIGWRVLLPAYPALILLTARTATLIPAAGLGRTVAIAAIVATVGSGLVEVRHLGRELSYANGLGASRFNLHDRLGDSNIDWGQGLPALRRELAARGTPVIYLSYAGTARPEAYGIRHERLPGWGQFHPPGSDRVDPAGPVLVAVSVSNLQGTYLRDPGTFRWLLSREPVSRTDDSIWLFDLTGDRPAIDRVRRLADSR